MCLAALAWGLSGRFPLVLASNRDEYFERPSADMAWWPATPGEPAVLAGRDLRAGGSWLGLNSAGRLALVTNVRRLGEATSGPPPPSRGQLVPQWLAGRLDAEAFCAEAARAGHAQYNLIVADWSTGTLVWSSSEREAPLALGPQPCLLGLSNAQLDTPWPKLSLLKQRMSTAIVAAEADAGEGTAALAQRLFAALADRGEAADELLPETGVGLDRERWLSPAFIRSPDGRYGTRCSTLLICERRAGRLQTRVIERRFDPQGTAVDTLDTVLGDWPPAPAPGF